MSFDLDRVRWVATIATGATLTVFLILWILTLMAVCPGCAPVMGDHTAKARPFVLVVHNEDVAFAETASVSWWGGNGVGRSERLIPAGGSAVFPIGGLPEGVAISALAWPDASSFGGLPGIVFQEPEYRAWKEWHVRYPSGDARGEVRAR